MSGSPVFAIVIAIVSNLAALSAAESVSFPPRLPGDAVVVSESSPDFLKPSGSLRPGVVIAKTPPIIDFGYYPGQTYPGRPWSNWGDSLAVGGKYYASIGDHLAPAGNAFIYEYDPERKSFRQLLDLKKLLNLPEGHYVPGKIHSRLDLGRDGWLYCSTHRGSTKVTTDQYHDTGDWIIRVHPKTGEAEVVQRAPVARHCIPTSVLDPQRLIFYGGTTPGSGDASDIRFFAYDVHHKKLIYEGPNGPARAMIFAASTGRVYWVPGSHVIGELVRFDPQQPGPPQKVAEGIGLRAASTETPRGKVYTVSTGQGAQEATLFAFDTQRETVEPLGPVAVGKQSYITTIDADPSGRYFYYVPGAHGGAETDGSPVVQYDTRTKTRKVLAFLEPYFSRRYSCTLRGTYSVALDSSGKTLFITWNANRGSKSWDTCALTVIHIPESERD